MIPKRKTARPGCKQGMEIPVFCTKCGRRIKVARGGYNGLEMANLSISVCKKCSRR